MCRRGFFSLARNAWKKAEPKFQPLGGPAPSIEVGESFSTSDRAARVLHLIGSARWGSSGPLFALQAQGNQPAALISIDNLPLAAAAIVIVQEEPAERLRRLDVDREQTAAARGWAAQIFRAGAETVILMPAAPIELSEQMITAFAHRLWVPSMLEVWRARSPRVLTAPEFWQLADAVRAARGAISQFRPPTASEPTEGHTAIDTDSLAETMKELAMEITIFSRSRFLSSVNRFTGFAHTGGLR
jgi:hypothetical protein